MAANRNRIDVLIFNDIFDREGAILHEDIFQKTMEDTFNAKVRVVHNPEGPDSKLLPFSVQFLHDTFGQHYNEACLENLDTAVVALWTHGTSDNYLKGRNGRPINILRDVLSPLKKIFIGKFLWLMLHNCRSFPDEDGAVKKDVYFVLSFPTTEGQVAVRDHPWTYIPTLCDLLREHGTTMGLKDILDKCRNTLMEDYPDNFPPQVPGYRDNFNGDFNLFTGLMTKDDN